jgi:phage baseplate assembly protein W
MTVMIDASEGMDLVLFPENEETDIIQNVYCILQTVMGSVPHYREYGVDTNYLHRPLPVARAAYAVAITNAIRKFETRAKLRNVDFYEDPLYPGELYPLLEVEIP